MDGPDEADEYCPHCDNHFLREAVTKEGVRGLSAGGPSTPAFQDVRKQTYDDSVGDPTKLNIVRDTRMEGQGIQSTLEAIADSSGRLG
jgi:hypothetical protein